MLRVAALACESAGGGVHMWFGWGIVATLLHPRVNVLEVRAHRLAFCISMVAGFQSCFPC